MKPLPPTLNPKPCIQHTCDRVWPLRVPQHPAAIPDHIWTPQPRHGINQDLLQPHPADDARDRQATINSRVECVKLDVPGATSTT